MIKDAFRHMVKLETIPLKRFSLAAVQEKAIALAVEQCGLPRRIGVPLGDASTNSATGARIAVAGSTGDAEGRTTCEVLRNMVQNKMGTVVTAVFSPEETS